MEERSWFTSPLVSCDKKIGFAPLPIGNLNLFSRSSKEMNMVWMTLTDKESNDSKASKAEQQQ